MAKSVIRDPADVWMLVRAHPMPLKRSTGELAVALGEIHGPRFAVWHTDELLFGVREGRLFLRTLAGLDVPAPSVVCVRQVPGTQHHDREVTLLRHLERMGAVLLNPLEAQLTCHNKFWQLQELALAGLPVPDSLSYATAPLPGVVRSAAPDMPCVVKSVNGLGGNGVFLAQDTRMLHDVAGSLAQEVPYLFQEYVAPSHGRDLRVVVVDGEPVAAEVRTSRDGALASNLARGGRAELCHGRYPEAEALAVQAAKSVGLVIAGVDLLFGADDSYTVCEVNAVPAWRPAMTGVVPAIAACVARHVAARR
ncbi:RimK family alpha-L-glutamate ligase [Streptomyces olivoreticuli]|uniref:ATP-grasp domain-containing protein n=1 Tax=Streptomyces olivoreticuli TaxID=68246 RepID=UPI00265919CA|nr:RimK family alpha-L-glutamate ligase [Streptomyces olivoreticuli]WKK23596.1 RimK family alpha-L-glutamate ligase [Streptomyces olivoreticuli]